MDSVGLGQSWTWEQIVKESKFEHDECKGCDYDFEKDCNEGCCKIKAMDEAMEGEED